MLRVCSRIEPKRTSRTYDGHASARVLTTVHACMTTRAPRAHLRACMYKNSPDPRKRDDTAARARGA
eukprot:10638493-Lingulodinium_polyedra.AAC.1